MVVFDPNNIFTYDPTFVGTNPLTVLTQMGMPKCVLEWDKTIMALLPNDVLIGLQSGLAKGVQGANGWIADLFKIFLTKFDITVFDSETGTFTLQSSIQKKYGGGVGGGNVLGALGSFLGDVIGVGATLYKNIEIATDTWEKLEACWEDLEAWGEADFPEAGVEYGTYGSAYVAAAKQSAELANTFIAGALAQMDIISEIIEEREADPSLIPVTEEELAAPLPDEPIFDLIYGPPVMKKGQLILSMDGLYYNSQTGDYGGFAVPQAADIGFVPPADKWKLNHFASLGGRGESYSIEELGEYVDTLFDPNLVDDGKDMLPYYNADHFLNVLINQKTKDVYGVSSQINDLASSGYPLDSAMVVNLRQSLYSTISNHNIKINKRKKQLEVAAKAPDLFGSEFFLPGKVPVNDFSFLKNINLPVDVKKQRKLTFVQGEVSSVVLPLNPKFVKAVDSESQTLVNHLVVPSVGTGSITYRNSLTDPSTSSLVEIVSITDNIVTDELFAIYNFLDGKVVSPNSREYQVLNCATLDNYNNCQLVSASAQDVFRKGVGIPFLRGVPKVGFNATTSQPTISGAGNYLKMPQTPEFQNLFYSPDGMSVDLWLHLPHFNELVRPWTPNSITNPPITDSGDGKYSNYQYHKLILACENTGGDDLNEDATQITNNKSSQTVRGLAIGFSREKQLYRPGLGFEPIGDYEENQAATTGEGSNLRALSTFYIAPTQSTNTKDAEFINSGECYSSGEGINVFSIETAEEINGVKFDDAKESFVHLNVSFNIPEDIISVYLDGELHSTAKVTTTFGTEKGKPIQLPTFYTASSVTTSSFQYSKATVNQVGTTAFNGGPNIDGFFTPWIVGGGWTDGIPGDYYTAGTANEGGFMSSRHGLKSGLDGYIGSLKFYSRPLNKDEVKQNFNTQKNFFKNIKL